MSKLINDMDYRCLALEFIDEGILTPESVVYMCMKYMSNDDVKDMLRCNELGELIEEYEVG